MKAGSNRIGGFFFEIVIVILFFSISVTVILQLFLSAKNRAQQSRELSAAIIKTQTVAEQIKGMSDAGQLPEALKTAAHTGSVKGTEHYTIYYDRQWNETKNAPSYSIEVTLTKSTAGSDILIDAAVLAQRCGADGKSRLFAVYPSKYLPGTS